MVPVKDGKSTKLRLSNVLTNQQRQRLTIATLVRLLISVERSTIDRSMLVSSTPAIDVSDIVECRKCLRISESHSHGGVNNAMTDGFLMAKKRFGCSVFAFLPSDLPFISPSLLDEVNSLADRHELIISPSTRRDGTNLLAFKGTDVPITLCYDNDSFNNHVRQAEARQLDYVVLDKKEFLHDLDDKEDLEFAMSEFGASDFEELLMKIRKI